MGLSAASSVTARLLRQASRLAGLQITRGDFVTVGAAAVVIEGMSERDASGSGYVGACHTVLDDGHLLQFSGSPDIVGAGELGLSVYLSVSLLDHTHFEGASGRRHITEPEIQGSKGIKIGIVDYNREESGVCEGPTGHIHLVVVAGKVVHVVVSVPVTVEYDITPKYNKPVAKQNTYPRYIVLEERGISSKKSRLCGINIEINYPTGGGSKVSSNPIYGLHRPDVFEDYEFDAPLDARFVTNLPTQYDSEHVLEFQLPQQFFAHLDLPLSPFDHLNPAVTRKLTFCQLIQEHWDIPPSLPQQFPTDRWKTDKYVLLEHDINTPAKGKAWGGTTSSGREIQITDTSKWIQNKLSTHQGASGMIKSMRYLIGEILRHQKDRIGNVLDLFETEILKANPRKPAPYQPWQPLGLKIEWDSFMKGKLALVQTKTMKVLNEFLARLQEQWSDGANREAAVIDPDKDDANIQADKQGLKDLIDRIDAMDNVLRGLPAWTWPF
ncbi:hypothetical protein F5B20DRAFT_596779 [Whalleya microplaca]|nr:hypothetical protein F5B20DRAFT_596779 [Whalleya microplaca]